MIGCEGDELMMMEIRVGCVAFELACGGEAWCHHRCRTQRNRLHALIHHLLHQLLHLAHPPHRRRRCLAGDPVGKLTAD